MTTDDAIARTFAAMRPEQTDVYARSVRHSVRRAVAGVQGEPFRLGRFTVLDLLGGGGMGTVFVAYDPDLDRKIALKVLHTRGERGRRDVLREGRALARLKHRGVVAVYEVGVLDEQVFLAMEHIAGVDLRAWLSEPRPPEAILALLVEAGEGLAAAHDAGLVHLDVKPANILVDAAGHARVIDFGLAREVEELPTTTLEDAARSPSSTSSLVGGTPAYMPPERLQGGRGDHRCDQYSFCVTCWEALFGRRPEPGEEPATGAARAPSRVVRALRRGMSPRPEDRFPSMHALLRELAARPRRRWAAVGVAAAAVLGLTLGAHALGQRSAAPSCPSPWPQIDATWNDARAAAVRAGFMATSAPFAGDVEATARRSLDRYAAAWVAARAAACDDTLVRGSVPRVLLDQRLACLEDRRLHLAALVERFADADDEALERAVEAIEGLPSIDACAGLTPSAMFGGDRARVEERMALRELMARARIEVNTGRPAAAGPQIDEALARARTIDSPSLLAEVLVLASDYDRLGERPERALERGREALRVAVEGGDAVQAGWAAVRLVQILAVHPDGSSRDDLLALAAAFSANAGDPSDLRVELLITQGAELLGAGRYAQAIEPFERARALAQESGHTRAAVLALVQLGNGRGAVGEQEASIAAYRQALAELEPLVGEMYPWFAKIHANIGAAYVALGKHDAALATFERAMKIAEANYPADDNRISAVVLSNIGLSYTFERRLPEALAAFEEALAVNERVYGTTHYEVAGILVNMAQINNDLDRLDEALAAAERATAIHRELLPPDHCEVFVSRRIHAGVLRQLGRGDEAVAMLEPLFAHFEAAECPPAILGQVELEVARTLVASRRDPARARALLDSAAGRMRGREALEEIERLRSGLR
ncbi:MAG: serine/threonine-protein kinase [Nannocystaceae bacterium]